MQIFVDADACPVVGIVEKVAKEHSVPVTLLCDTNHVLSSDYSEVIVVGAGADAVDYKLISICHKGDIVVSQDYGVAAMALGKGTYAIHQSGKWYTNENIDQMLMERHLNKKARRAFDMKEKGMSKGEFNSVAQANGGLENMINWEGKDKDLLALIKYIAEEDKLEKVLENPQVIKTPVVRNGKQSTLGYQPDIWKTWK